MAVRALVTHSVIVGMTGSGKTGLLCVTVREAVNHRGFYIRSSPYRHERHSFIHATAPIQLCCHGANYNPFGTYNGQCMCGAQMPANTTVCPQSTAEACITCCNGAGYATGDGQRDERSLFL
jgi:hypothetical protein